MNVFSKSSMTTLKGEMFYARKKDFYQQKKSEKSWGDQPHIYIDISAS